MATSTWKIERKKYYESDIYPSIFSLVNSIEVEHSLSHQIPLKL
jgi:hypothetical protein